MLSNMINEVLLSVIIPIFNTKSYVCCAVQSVLNQSLYDMEIILVDDGSTDGSGEIADEYAQKDKRIVVIHQDNAGMQGARLSGIRKASGRYITFVDSDDWIEDGTYENLLEFMRDDYDVIAFQLCRYYSDNDIHYPVVLHKEGLYERDEIEKNIFKDLIWNVEKQYFGIDPSLCTKIIKRNLILEEIKKAYSHEFTIGEDASITWPLFKSIKSFYLSTQVMYYHRQKNGFEVAGYIKDKAFNRNLVNLYEYLFDEFEVYPGCIRQLDWFFAIYAGYRLKLYGEKIIEKKYLFPFDMVEKGSRVVLYGAGVVGKSYYKQIKASDYCSVEVWVDVKEKEFDGVSILKPEILEQYRNLDVAIICIEKQQTAEEIKSILVSYGIDPERIVWRIRTI